MSRLHRRNHDHETKQRELNTYLRGIPENIPHVQDPLSFEFESTGIETHFGNLRDPDWRSRRVFVFFLPETLHDWIKELDTLRDRLSRIPHLAKASLRDCQFEAVTNLEQSSRRVGPGRSFRWPQAAARPTPL